MRTRNKLALLVIGALIFVQAFIPSVAKAAGNAVITAEANSPLVVGQTTEMQLYVTASGANLYGISFRAAFTKLSFVANSFNAAGTDFNGVSTIITSSANQVEIAASYQGAFGPTAGATGKLYIGKIMVQADSAAGTGRVSFDQIAAADNNNESMTVSGQPRTVTITTATCPTGQVGTPPNCTTPSSGEDNTPPAAGAAQDGNQVSVPVAQDEPKTEIISDEVLKAALSNPGQSDNTAKDSAEERKVFPWDKIWIAGGVFFSVIILLIMVGLSHRRYSSWKELHRHIAVPYNPHEAPKSQPSEAVHPPQTKQPLSTGPTIIRPTNRDEKDNL